MKHLNTALFALFIYATGCTSAPEAKEPTLVADTQRMDSRGCMISSEAPTLPAKLMSFKSSSAVEVYYEKLEYYLLLSAENCIGNSQRCGEFESAVSGIPARLLSSNKDVGSAEVQNTIRHSNNKIVAMVAINAYLIEKTHKKTLPAQKWLKSALIENNFLNNSEELLVVSENKKYSSSAHNMAATSARAHVFVGLLAKDTSTIDKGLAQIPKILETVRDDGSLPLETRRGARALRYSMQVLSDIIAMMDAVPARQELFQKYQPTLERMAGFNIAVLKNNALVNAYAKDNLSPGPIQDPKLQDISSLRSRLAWILVFNKLDSGFMSKIEDTELDKRACAHAYLKKKPECSPLIQSVGDAVSSPLGFTLGYNPKCASL